MNRKATIFVILIPVIVLVALLGDAAPALLIISPLIAVTLISLNRNKTDGPILIRIFLAAIFIRLLISALIVGFQAQSFFGEDGVVHEIHGYQLFQSWWDGRPLPYYLKDWNRPWGLHYLIAVIYSIVGRVPLAVNFVSSFCGALTAVFVFQITKRTFQNTRAAIYAATLVAFFPAMIIWSSQIMKDGFVVLFVVIVIWVLIRIQDKFSYVDLALLGFSLVAILSVRFYIFYFAVLAAGGSFLFGGKNRTANNIRGLVVATCVAIFAAYTGVLTVGTEQVEKISNLENVQYSRSSLSTEAASGYNSDTDIRTLSGAASAFPIGLTNLMLAPFPWQFSSIRSALTLPEMIIWWALIPCLFIGAKYTLTYRFRAAIPILLFTITLTVVYALFQTNVGTAYRQRTQIQVFLFIFIAVGWTILKERRDDRKLIAKHRQFEFESHLRERIQEQ